MAEAIQAELDRLKPLYDEAHALRAEAKVLSEAQEMAEVRRRALTAAQRRVDDAEDRISNLRSREARSGTQKAPKQLPVGRAIETKRVDARPATERPQSVLHSIEAPARIQPESRDELKSRIGRFIRVRLNAEGQTMLAEVNRLLSDPDHLVGEALVLLDWSVAWAEPLHRKEDEEKWRRRLAEWGEALEEYLERLRGDVQVLRGQFNDLLPLLDLWRQLTFNPVPWEAFIEESRAALHLKADELEKEADGILARMEEPRKETGAP